MNWKKYNLDQEKFAKQIKNYNKKNIFNYIHLDKSGPLDIPKNVVFTKIHGWSVDHP